MSETSSRNVVLYVRSVEVPKGGPSQGFFHCQACERHRVDVTQLQTPIHLQGRVFSDADWQAINLVQRIQAETGCEVEIVDLAKGMLRRMRLRRRGISKTPTFVVDGKVLPPITSYEQLAKFLAVGVTPSTDGLHDGRRRQRSGKILTEANEPPSGALREK